MYPIDKISQNIYDEIVNLVKIEEAILKNLGKGIFSMPELALSYKLGISLLQNQKELFGSEGWDANREIKLYAPGPTDLVLKNPESDKDIMFEFKINGRYKGDNSYFSDIEKLLKHPSEKYIKYFCALVDAFVNQGESDERIYQVNTEYNSQITWKPDSFESSETNYKNSNDKYVYVVALWRINIDDKFSKTK